MEEGGETGRRGPQSHHQIYIWSVRRPWRRHPHFIESPTGLDFPVHSTRAILKNEAHEFWEWIYGHTGTDASGTGSYTAELHLLQDVRVVFTADPENTKAILTTQFQDFGKGKDNSTPQDMATP